MNKAYFDTKLSSAECHLSSLGKDYNDFKLRSGTQSKDVLIENGVKTTTERLYDKGLFDKYDNAEEALKENLFVSEVNERRMPNLEEIIVDDNVNQRFFS